LKPSTPEELYASLPTKKLKENEAIRKAKEDDIWRKGVKKDLKGVYKVDADFYNKLTVWNWFQIFTFTNTNPVTGAKYSKRGNVEKPIGYNREVFVETFKKIFEKRRLNVGEETDEDDDESGKSGEAVGDNEERPAKRLKENK
jgi:hypothetical protein